jgi:uncharacterized protein (TIGR02145 family)
MFTPMFHGQNRNTISGFGYFYSYSASVNANFAPSGWTLPSYSELSDLKDFLGSSGGGDLKINDLNYWKSPNTGASNTYGFNGKGVGFYFDDAPTLNLAFKEVLDIPAYDFPSDTLFHGSLQMTYNQEALGTLVGTYKNTFANTVRLIYTGAGTPTSPIYDYDGNKYNIIQIGTQYWIDRAWKSTHLNNGIAITYSNNADDWNNSDTTIVRVAPFDNESYV